MGGGFRMIQVHYIYCALYFYYYCIVIYNEIIIQLSLTTPLSVRCWCESASSWFIMFSVQTSLLMIICICSRSPALASLSQLHLRLPGIGFSYGADNLDLSRGQFLVGFVLLRESNATAGLTWGSAQAAMWGVGAVVNTVAASSAHPPFTSSCVAQFLTGHRPVLGTPDFIHWGPQQKDWGRTSVLSLKEKTHLLLRH